MMRWVFVTTTVFSCGLIALAAQGGPPAGQNPYEPKIAPASDEGARAAKTIQAPEGTQVTLYAAEPLLANPVCFCFDEKGRLFVAETFRLHSGVTDNRSHMRKIPTWLDEDLACRTVADRLAMYKKDLKDFSSYDKEHDRIRLLEDTKGAGVIDKATVFADGFSAADSGIGAGLLARGGKVWYTCIPDLWLLHDTKGTGKADVRKSLQHGYGVHTSYLGHDLHGLRMGPDGKLYFSMGDRGFHVETAGRILSNPDSGAVLRCNPDGSELEIVAIGLRNPQELAFDQYGNLFTGDNNADAGDAARLVYVVEGGDSGWRIGYQEMNNPVRLGPWNAERVWGMPFDQQPANVVPPCGHIANGPAGFTYNPGVTQIPQRYQEHFFLCDFRGDGGKSGVHAFKLKPRGAAFEFAAKPEHFVWSVLATDCDFGPDGAFYVSDWVNGWEKTGKGRIYKIGDAERAKDPALLRVKQLLAEGMAQRPQEELVALLEHADMRIRLEAQFELAARGFAAPLLKVVQSSKNQPARLHGLWGLGQIARRFPNSRVLQAAEAWLKDDDAQVRTQAAKLIGEHKLLAAYTGLVERLKDDQPPVRFQAALALGKLGKVDAIPAICQMLKDNGDKDPYLRHAGVMALTRIGSREDLRVTAKDPAPALRLAALLAMRRLEMPEAAWFLSDADPRLVLEAARAINDTPIKAALPHLAALAPRTGMSDPLLYRVINANFRLGMSDNAQALAKLAGRSDVPTALRVEALNCLLDWAKPSWRDRIVGLWRPLAPRPGAEAADALRANIGTIFSGSDKVRSAAAKVAAKYGIKEVGPVLLDIAGDPKRSAGVRLESLQALVALKDKQLKQATAMALADGDAQVRTQGRRMLAKLEPMAVLEELTTALDKGDVTDRQGALEILGDLKEPGADDLLKTWLAKLLAKEVPPEVQLDLLEAAAKHPSADMKALLAKVEAAHSPKDHLSKWRESLQGGNAEAGKKIFFDRTEVSCLRCHKIQGTGGEVGPELTGIGGKQNREYLLESIVEPDKQIAKGYETVVLTLNDGKVKSGILKSEDKKEVRLMTPEGTVVVVPVEEIDSRARGPSAMPGDVMKHLSRRDLRDLVEFLSSLK
jgi:quinoprotein glucose dehydrogenase